MNILIITNDGLNLISTTDETNIINIKALNIYNENVVNTLDTYEKRKQAALTDIETYKTKRLNLSEGDDVQSLNGKISITLKDESSDSYNAYGIGVVANVLNTQTQIESEEVLFAIAISDSEESPVMKKVSTSSLIIKLDIFQTGISSSHVNITSPTIYTPSTENSSGIVRLAKAEDFLTTPASNDTAVSPYRLIEYLNQRFSS